MRKTKIVQITDKDSRDFGKQFLLTEMASRPAEKWGAQFFAALGRANVEIPPEVARAGIIGVLFTGIKMLGNMKFEDAEPLMDTMMSCVKIMPNVQHPEVVRSLVDNGTEGDDIEDISTRLLLREEVFILHVGFTPADAVQKLASTASALTSSTTQTLNPSLDS